MPTRAPATISTPARWWRWTATPARCKWHFQFTPHDSHDWDSTHVPVLFEAEVRGQQPQAGRHGQPQRLLLRSGPHQRRVHRGPRRTPNRPGPRAWTTAGGPSCIPNTEPSEEGTLVWPNLNGATVWFSPAYSPHDQPVLRRGARDRRRSTIKREAEYKPGTFFAGGGEGDIPNGEQSGAIRALDATTGEMRWEFPMHSAPWAGVLATARRAGVFGLGRRQFLRPRRQDRQAALGLSDRRPDCGQPRVVHRGRQAVRGDCGRSCAVCVRTVRGVRLLRSRFRLATAPSSRNAPVGDLHRCILLKSTCRL